MLGMPGYNNNHEVFVSRVAIEQVYMWWPHRCGITGKRLWFTSAYKGIVVWSGPGEPIEEVRYYDTAEYLMQQLNSKEPI
jgi:hypothetical protein